MKFYKYLDMREKGIKRFSNEEYTSKEVKEILQEKKDRYLFLPTYQDRGRDFRPLYSPCKGIKTIEELEEFLHPKKKTFVWDNNEWKLKIHTPEQLLDFYETLIDGNRETNRFVQNIENVKKCISVYDDASLQEISEYVDKDSSAYRIGVFQGALMSLQMEQIEVTGGILISKNLEYVLLEEPCEHFNFQYVSNDFEYPEETPEEELGDR